MDNLFSILLIPLLAGYIFCHSVPFLDIKVKNQSGHHLVMYILIAGLLFLLPISYFLYISIYPLIVADCLSQQEGEISRTCKLFGALKYIWDFFYEPIVQQLAQSKNPTTGAILKSSLLSLAIAAFIAIFLKILDISRLLTWCLSWIRRQAGREDFKNKAGVLGGLVLKLAKAGQPVVITLKSRKVYIGYISDIPHVGNSDNWHIKLLPLRSGYRTTDQLRLQLDNDYRGFLDIIKYFPALPKNQDVLDVQGQKIMSYAEAKNMAYNFGIVINWKDIETVSVWIPELFHYFGNPTLFQFQPPIVP